MWLHTFTSEKHGSVKCGLWWIEGKSSYYTLFSMFEHVKQEVERKQSPPDSVLLTQLYEGLGRARHCRQFPAASSWTPPPVPSKQLPVTSPLASVWPNRVVVSGSSLASLQRVPRLTMLLSLLPLRLLPLLSVFCWPHLLCTLGPSPRCPVAVPSPDNLTLSCSYCVESSQQASRFISAAPASPELRILHPRAHLLQSLNAK